MSAHSSASVARWSSAGAVGLIVAWEAAVRLLDVRPFVLLAPSEILRSFVDDPGFYLSDTWVTARHLVIGVAISLAISLVVGAAFIWSVMENTQASG